MGKKRFIPVAAPTLCGNEKKYVMDCLDSTWISSNGSYISRFEEEFARYCGVRHAIACCNGTVALHVLLRALSIGPGDEVIVPTLTFVATANAVTYCGATPVFVDSESYTWNIDPHLLEEKITERTKAIIVVHLYGHPCDMSPIAEIARRHNLYLIEDAAEAHGAQYRGRRVGGLGDAAVFSFFGNKIITTGEGGMITTNNSELAAKLRILKGQGMDPNRRYWFIEVGYNYRMTNVAAAIGLAQLEKIDWHLQRRQEIANWYKESLGNSDLFRFQGTQGWAVHANWMVSILIHDCTTDRRDKIMAALHDRGIETRPVFYPLHTLPIYRHLAPPGGLPVAEHLASQGLNLPTWAGLSREDISFISQTLREIVNNS